MTLLLQRGTKPANLAIKTFGLGSMGNTVFLGDYEISLEDFLFATEYVLTNTGIEPGDPRLLFVKSVQSMDVIEGFNGPGTKRLRASVSMVFPKKIRIIGVPPGKAPKKVREQWLNVKMSLLPEQKPGSAEYQVDFDVAIYALAKKDDEVATLVAAKWWIDWRRETQEGRTAEVLFFPKEVCELIP